MSAAPHAAASPWDDAVLAAAVIATDPGGLGGVHAKARAGPVRDRWLKYLHDLIGPDTPSRRIAAGILEGRLAGGLDIGATLDTGRPVVETGVLAAAHGGFVVLSMAERLGASPAGLIATALDDGHVRIERDGISARMPARIALVALDEAADDSEFLEPALADRLGLRIDLDPIGWRDAAQPVRQHDVAAAKALLPSIIMGPDLTEALCAFGLSAGAASMRLSLHLVRAARAVAALRGAQAADMSDALTAIRLVMGIAPLPEPVGAEDSGPAPPEPAPPEPEPDSESADDALSEAAARDMLLQAIEASLPKHLLDGIKQQAARRGSHGATGKAGAARERGARGRRIGTSDKPQTPGARLDVLATLRQAAPWQRVRARDGAGTSRLRIRKDDFRYARYQENTATTAVFVVDASGSAALDRLAETKGAIELLLAECYVRRDSVALIAFRGQGAETLLEPTRSLVRAKRSLSALPGGGGTPLADGIVAALAMATGCIRKGQSVVTVFLTDGRGNVGLEGTTDRDRVAEDTAKAARMFRGCGLRALLVDTAQRPQPRAAALARDLGAEYLPLPRAGSHALSREVGARMEASHG